MNKFQLHLKDLAFIGFHGLYEGEQKTGNTFIVNIEIEYTIKEQLVEKLEQTIDYVSVYALANQIMLERTPLLETLATKIVHQILEKFSNANFVRVSIQKEKLAIPGLEGKAIVRFEKIRNL